MLGDVRAIIAEQLGKAEDDVRNLLPDLHCCEAAQTFDRVSVQLEMCACGSRAAQGGTLTAS